MLINTARRLLLAQLSTATYSELQATPLRIASNQKMVVRRQTKTVATESELYAAINIANKFGGHTTIELRPGSYQLDSTISLDAPGIFLSGAGKNANEVTISGDSMGADAKVKNLIRITSSNCRVSNLKLSKAGWHLVQVVGDRNVKHSEFLDCIFEDSWEQMLKVTKGSNGEHASHGLIRGCVFRYTKGIGPQWYVGGVDAHGASKWIVTENIFQGISSPSHKIAQHAIHFWSNSSDNLIERNLILNCDRGIGFGLKGNPNTGGMIQNNLISHNVTKHPFSDASIVVEDCIGAEINHNTCITDHNYPNSIECRRSTSTNVVIRNNITNRSIKGVQNTHFQATGNFELKVLPSFTSGFEHLNELEKNNFEKTLRLKENERIFNRSVDYFGRKLEGLSLSYVGAVDLNKRT